MGVCVCLSINLLRHSQWVETELGLGETEPPCESTQQCSVLISGNNAMLVYMLNINKFNRIPGTIASVLISEFSNVGRSVNMNV